MKKVVAGIDVGGTYTKFGLVDRSGRVYGKGSIPSDTHNDVELSIIAAVFFRPFIITVTGFL